VAKSIWQAHYFSSFDNRAPAERIVLIEANDEMDAGKLAVAQMGRCMRVDVVRPLWETPSPLIAQRGSAPAGTNGQDQHC
jgi:stage III sporulation protein SpoIIIAA